MATKICHQCRAEVDTLAKVCSHCRAKLGAAGAGNVAKKPTSFIVGCLSVFVGVMVLGMVVQAIINKPEPPAPILLPSADAKTVFQSVEAVRKDGGVVVQGVITLPQDTEFIVSFYPDANKPKEFGQSKIKVGRNGTFATEPFFTNKLVKPGEYKVQFHSGIIMQGIQPQSVLGLIGPLGEKLPRSVVQPAGKPFSNDHVMIVEIKKLRLS